MPKQTRDSFDISTSYRWRFNCLTGRVTVHPTEQQLEQYALHRAGSQRMRILRHLEECEQCQALLRQQKDKAQRTRSFERFAFNRMFCER